MGSYTVKRWVFLEAETQLVTELSDVVSSAQFSAWSQPTEAVSQDLMLVRVQVDTRMQWRL